MKTKQIKIAICVDTFFPTIDGVVRVVDNYAKGLSKMADVTVFAPKMFKKDALNFPYKVVLCNYSLPLKWLHLDYSLPLPNLDLNFIKNLKNGNYDIVHIHSPFSIGKTAVKICNKLKIPVIATMHSQYKLDFFKSTKNNSITNLLTKNIAKVFNKCNELWTMNSYCKKLSYTYGYKGKIFLIPNGSSLLPNKTLAEYKTIANNTYNLKKYKNILLYVGRINTLKNIYLIIDALEILISKNIKFFMIFVGDGEELKTIKKIINQKNLSEHTLFLGKITDSELLMSLYARSDIFIFPSLYDTDGIVKIEAAGLNTPSICVKNTAASSTIKNKHNGFLINNSALSLANCIIKILNNKKLLQQVGLNARKNLYLTWDNIINTAYNRYKKILTEHKANLKLLQLNKLKNKIIYNKNEVV